ncbi:MULTISPECIES: GntR family transcriptional regulator [unclassified Roseitalea]|uniref:GntR family transcriptional regulator n=1 Tax=unclassified Roseitalea TaxID=2639107 RepID=UPI00273E3F9F|nr:MULTISPECIES: GntR family transcriptional regulator [unclassified Roseitalea]
METVGHAQGVSMRSGEAGEPVSNASERAYRSISNLIKDRKLKGGDRIVEKRLADQLGVSRTPLREALQRLEGEGLVLKSANQPYVVRKVDLRDYLQSLRVRKTLEAEAAALATGRIEPRRIGSVRDEVLALEQLRPYDVHAHWACDDHVHNLFIDACGNQVMADILYELRTTTRLFEIAQLADRLGPDSREHVAILDALEAGDAEGARAAMATHAQSLFDFAVDQVG